MKTEKAPSVGTRHKKEEFTVGTFGGEKHLLETENIPGKSSPVLELRTGRSQGAGINDSTRKSAADESKKNPDREKKQTEMKREIATFFDRALRGGD